MTSTPEQALAALVSTPVAIPEAVLGAATRQLLDCVGVTIAASSHKAGQIIGSWLTKSSGQGASRVLGTSLATTPSDAAFGNGSLAHLLDFDDTGFSHPTACIYPAALAVAEEIDATGLELVTAMVVGYEVFERLAAAARAYEPSLRRRGVHPTSVWGAPAAAASVAYLRHLDEDATVTAFGIAASAAGGITQQFGSWAKGLNAGNASRSGVLAADLASLGYDGDDRGLSGPYGLLAAFVGEGNFDVSGLWHGLGESWAIVEPGVSIKPYPACTSTLRAVDAMVKIAAEDSYRADKVERVLVHVHPDLLHTLRFRAPTKGFNGKFSLDYAVASVALDHSLTLASFEDSSATRPELRRMLERVELVEHPEWDLSRRYDNPVEVFMVDGGHFKESVQAHRGTRSWPLSDEEVQRKFHACVSPVLGDQVTLTSAETLWRTPAAPSVREIVDLLTLSRSRAG